MQPKGSPFVVPLHDLVVVERQLDRTRAQEFGWRVWAWTWFLVAALLGICLLATLTGSAQ
jgi:hypothetical protein